MRIFKLLMTGTTAASVPIPTPCQLGSTFHIFCSVTRLPIKGIIHFYHNKNMYCGFTVCGGLLSWVKMFLLHQITLEAVTDSGCLTGRTHKEDVGCQIPAVCLLSFQRQKAAFSIWMWDSRLCGTPRVNTSSSMWDQHDCKSFKQDGGWV